MVARILGSVSRQESEHHAERRKAANRERRLAGVWRKEGSRPFGFNGDGTHREPEATMIRDAVTDILGGVSIHAIARRWNATGVTTVRGVAWTNLHVRRVLSNPRLAALVFHKNKDTGENKEIGPGNWEPIVDETLWRGLQAMLEGRARGMAFERVHLLSGVALCATCGKPLYGRYAHGRDATPTYVCRQSHVARLVPPLDDMISKLVVAHLSTQRVERAVDISDLEARRSALVATRGQLATLLRQGLLTEDDIATEARSIQRDLEDIAKEIAARQPSLLGGSLLERWNAAGVEGRSAVVDSLLFIAVYPQRGKRLFDPALIWHRWR
jgi:hypothetical protein